MKGKPNYVLEDLSNSADELLREIEDLDKIGAPDDGDDRVRDEIRTRELADLDRDIVSDVDGTFDIRIAENDLKALANFYPPSRNGKDIDGEDVIQELASTDVVFGIDRESIRKAVTRCNEERVQVSDVIVALGTPPVDEIPEHFVLREDAGKKKTVREEGGSIDYREVTSYTLVEKGEVLADVVPKREGEFGKSVKGLFLPYAKQKITGLKPLKNTRLKEGRIVAECDGRLMVSNNKVWINEVFELSGNVDYSTGNIDFPGDIIINGQVKDGFEVVSGGSIFCRETLDASMVKCEGDLSVCKGIIGRKKGKVSVGGSIATRFIENCHVEAGGGISVQTGILHSVVNTHESLQMGDKSVIVGGKITALNGVVASQVGTGVGVRTEIHCGVDYTVEQKLLWVKEKMKSVSEKRARVDERIKRGDKDPRLGEIKEKLELGVHHLNRSARDLVGRLNKNQKADVKVRGTLYPGVYVEICNIGFVNTRERSGVRLHLDKNGDKITVDQI